MFGGNYLRARLTNWRRWSYGYARWPNSRLKRFISVIYSPESDFECIPWDSNRVLKTSQGNDSSMNVCATFLFNKLYIAPDLHRSISVSQIFVLKLESPASPSSSQSSRAVNFLVALFTIFFKTSIEKSACLGRYFNAI